MFGVSRPLKVVQIDHTNADIFVVDEEARQPIGRLAVSSQDDCVVKIAKLWIACLRECDCAMYSPAVSTAAARCLAVLGAGASMAAPAIKSPSVPRMKGYTT